MHLLESVLHYIPVFRNREDPFPNLDVEQLKHKLHMTVHEYEKSENPHSLKKAQDYLVSLSFRSGGKARKIYRHYDERISGLIEES